MRIEFPDLKNQEKRTLYIIGNGFDLFHGIDSKYEDFYYWLNSNRHKDFVRDFQNIFPKLNTNPDFLWSNFEEAMGDYDLDELYQKYYVEPKDELDHIWAPDEWKKTSERINSTCKHLRPLMKEWAKHIKIEDALPELELSKESWYLTFNYTTVLEDVYNIPSNHICHIHGHVNSNEDIIVGHDKNVYVDNIYADNFEDEQSKREIAKVMNEFVKHKDKQVKNNNLFFESIKDISHVVVLGHSLSKIDLLYFFRVLDHIQPKSNWHISKHYSNEENQLDILLNYEKENNNRIANYWIFNF